MTKASIREFRLASSGDPPTHHYLAGYFSVVQ